MNKLAPVVIFVYCRLKLTQQLLNALEKNKYAEKTELYIFADIPDELSLKPLSYKVINYINNYSRNSKFKRVHVKVAQKHMGLANSIIQGVTYVINKHGKAIVLEDDLLVSDNFLEFMQKALIFYKENPKIWSVTGNTEALPSLNHYDHSVYMSYRANSLGWGTWKNRWNMVDWNVSDYNKFKYNFIKRFLFNRGGNDLSNMLDCQMQKKEYDSWAIRFCYQQYKEGKWTVYPTCNKVIHVGNDMYATHGYYISSMPLCKEKNFKFENLAMNPQLNKELKYKYSLPAEKILIKKVIDFFRKI